MSEVTFLPIYVPDLFEILNGTIISAPSFCTRKCSEKHIKCEQHYKKVYACDDLLTICPYGFNTYRLMISDNILIFTGFRTRNRYTAKKADPKIIKSDRNFVISEEILNDIIQSYISFFKSKVKTDSLEAFIDEMIHDIRKFNAHINQRGQQIYDMSSNAKKISTSTVHNKVLNINAFSSYITLRLDTYNFIFHEENLQSGTKTIYNIHKVFHKSKKCLEGKANEKNIKIHLVGTSNCGDITAYECMEILPFIFLDNAIKYSPNGNDIHININDTVYSTVIEIKSIGPQLKDKEVDMLFKRGYRTESAKMISQDGSGLGLFIAKKICDLHQARLNITSTGSIVKTVNGILFTLFCIEITINKP